MFATGFAGIGLEPSAATCELTTDGVPTSRRDTRQYAAELAALAPDVMVASGFVAWRRTTDKSHHPGRVRRCHRSGRRRFCRKLSAAGRQRHRFCAYSSTQPTGKWWSCSNRSPPCDAGGDPSSDMRTASGIGQFGAIQVQLPSHGGGSSPGRGARRQRDRARHNRFRAWIEWRLDCYGEHVKRVIIAN